MPIRPVLTEQEANGYPQKKGCTRRSVQPEFIQTGSLYHFPDVMLTDNQYDRLKECAG
ncbi:MAG: hypothetical protein K0S39_526 [Paenibacillus sp.]|jgi:hypothetical protein|nr:hypothetical protein [Paenibacillus sp.]